MELHGTYGGVVEMVRDPERLGRLKVRVPFVHGVQDKTGYVSVTQLPWAMPAGMPAGGSAESGGFSHLPAVGDKVWVRFLDGEPEKPIWEWGMQSFADRDKLKLHPYEVAPSGEVGLPSSSFWTPFNHALELARTGVTAITSTGYRLRLVDSQTLDGLVELATARGNFIRLDDLDNGGTMFLNNDLNFLIGQSLSGLSSEFNWRTTALDFSVRSGRSVSLNAAHSVTAHGAAAATLSSGALAQVQAPTVTLGQSGAPMEPVVLGLRLSQLLETLLRYLSTHTHGNGNNGSPTTPPLQPVQPPAGSTAQALSKSVSTA